MAKEKIPMTPAIRVLKSSKSDFKIHQYKYVDKGGTEVAARELGVSEHLVVKTLIFEDESKNPLIVLMSGDLQVSAKELARLVNVKSVTPVDPGSAEKHTGYKVGGISPFGTRKKMPVYADETVLEQDHIYINAGRRGMLVEIPTKDLVGILDPVPVKVGLARFLLERLPAAVLK